MSDDKDTGKGLFKANWHRTPTAMIDLIMGASISPSAGWVVMTVIRYTQGMGGKKSAAIPTGTFKRVLGIKRVKTVYSIVDEAVNSGLINAHKKRGCVTSYSINESCELWHKEVVAESATSGDNCHTSSGDNCHMVGAESATPPVAESATHIKRDISKDILKEQNEENLFDVVYENIKNYLKQGGIIPIGEPVIDDQLRPEVYKFATWFKEKGIEEYKKPRQAVEWFQRIDIEERKRYYTPPYDHRKNYYTGSNEPKAPKITDERAAEIRAQYMGVIGF